MKQKHIIVIGGGIAGLSAACVAAKKGYKVSLYERLENVGGRLNVIKKNGYVFDTGPSFLTMTYTYRDLFKYCGYNLEDFVTLHKLDPNFTVKWKSGPTVRAWSDLDKLKQELDQFEDTGDNVTRFMDLARKRFDATYDVVINQNVGSIRDYTKIRDFSLFFDGSLTSTVWKDIGKFFTNSYVKEFFSLESFYLGMTPFEAPAVFTMLNHTDIVHDGVWRIDGGMYRLAEAYQELAIKLGVEIYTGAPLEQISVEKNRIEGIVVGGQKKTADGYIVTMDYVTFHDLFLTSEYGGSFQGEKARNLQHTMSFFTIYIGARKQFPNSDHHNYIIEGNFHEYITKLFSSSVLPENPYYYVTNASRYDETLAPRGASSLFVLVPVPNLSTEIDWKKEKIRFADVVLADLEHNGFAGLQKSIEVLEMYTPFDWQEKFNLYLGSGLGLSHTIRQLGPLRPNNYHSKIKNIFFAGASTIPGTGLPMVTISGRLAVERMEERMKWN